MSKFADKLRSIYKTAGPAIGFRKPDTETELPPLLLVANINKSGAKKSKSLIESGIDAAVVNSENIEVTSFKDLTVGMNNTPLGLALEDNSQRNIEELIKLGWDFVIFGLQTPVEVINKEGLGKILRIEPSLAPGLARAINELSLTIDGVLIDGDSSAVTIERLLACQFLAGLVGKPLLITANSSLTSGELSRLHEVGIKGLLFPEGTTPKTFTELKKLVNSLPKAPRHKTKTSVLLPRIGIPETRAKKVEEEEEEDEDI